MDIFRTAVPLATSFYNFGDVDLYTTKYMDGSTALVAIYDEGDEETLSVNLGGYDMHPTKGNVFVKDYSEHAGLTASLVAAGVAEVVRAVTFGFGHGFEVRLLH